MIEVQKIKKYHLLLFYFLLPPGQRVIVPFKNKNAGSGMVFGDNNLKYLEIEKSFWDLIQAEIKKHKVTDIWAIEN